MKNDYRYETPEQRIHIKNLILDVLETDRTSREVQEITGYSLGRTNNYLRVLMLQNLVERERVGVYFRYRALNAGKSLPVSKKNKIENIFITFHKLPRVKFS
jgi:hypothetical protein